MPPAGSGPRKIASIGVRVSRWVTTHGYALNVDLDPAPFTEWITACGLDDAAFTTMARELGRPITVDDVKPAAIAAVAEVFGLELRAGGRRRAGPRPPSGTSARASGEAACTPPPARQSGTILPATGGPSRP